MTFKYKDPSLVKQACEVIEEVASAREEDGLESLLPVTKETLLIAIDILESAGELKDFNQKYIDAYIDLGKNLIEIMPLVELHEFSKDLFRNGK